METKSGHTRYERKKERKQERKKERTKDRESAYTVVLLYWVSATNVNCLPHVVLRRSGAEIARSTRFSNYSAVVNGENRLPGGVAHAEYNAM
jgi:hypothetical protein